MRKIIFRSFITITLTLAATLPVYSQDRLKKYEEEELERQRALVRKRAVYEQEERNRQEIQRRQKAAEQAKIAEQEKINAELEAQFSPYIMRAMRMISSMMPICDGVMQQTFKPGDHGREIMNSLRPMQERDVVIAYKLRVKQGSALDRINHGKFASAEIDFFLKYNNWQDLLVRDWRTPDYGMTHEWGSWETMKGPSNYYDKVSYRYRGTVNLSLYYPTSLDDKTVMATVGGEDWNDIPDYFRKALVSYIESGYSQIEGNEYELNFNKCRSLDDPKNPPNNWIGRIHAEINAEPEPDFRE